MEQLHQSSEYWFAVRTRVEMLQVSVTVDFALQHLRWYFAARLQIEGKFPSICKRAVVQSQQLHPLQ